MSDRSDSVVEEHVARLSVPIEAWVRAGFACGFLDTGAAWRDSDAMPDVSDSFHASLREWPDRDDAGIDRFAEIHRRLVALEFAAIGRRFRRRARGMYALFGLRMAAICVATAILVLRPDGRAVTVFVVLYGAWELVLRPILASRFLLSSLRSGLLDRIDGTETSYDEAPGTRKARSP